MTVGPTVGGWHVALRTDAGRRDGNEDSVLSMRLSNGGVVIAVADGMGGLEAGDIASRTALEALRNSLTRGATLEQSVRDANRAVHERAAGRPMGTTLVVAHAAGHRVTVANVGDSRAYRCTPLGIRRISIDHTHSEQARQAGLPGDVGVVGGRWGGALTRSLGTAPQVDVDIFGPFEVDDGESILLCSDGVHGVLSDDRLEVWSQSLRDPEVAVEKLLNAALEAGSEDNVSAVVLHRPSPSRATQPAALRRSSPAWDPRVLVERSTVRTPPLGRGRRIMTGVVILAAVAAAVVWYVMR